MARVALVLVLVLAACGRIGFDPGESPHTDGGHDVDHSLIAFYPMETFASGTPDATGNGHDLVCAAGACPTLVEGRSPTNHAVMFDGTTQRLHTTGTHTADLMTSEGFTVATWFALADTPAARACVATKLLGTGHFNSWALCVEPPSRQLLFYSVTGTAEDLMFTNATVTSIAWHHAAIVWDHQTKSVWIDGAMAMAHAVPAIDFDTGEVSVGADRDNNATIAPFLGMIDDVRIYNRPLEAAEIADLASH